MMLLHVDKSCELSGFERNAFIFVIMIILRMLLAYLGRAFAKACCQIRVLDSCSNYAGKKKKYCEEARGEKNAVK